MLTLGNSVSVSACLYGCVHTETHTVCVNDDKYKDCDYLWLLYSAYRILFSPFCTCIPAVSVYNL